MDVFIREEKLHTLTRMGTVNYWFELIGWLKGVCIREEMVHALTRMGTVNYWFEMIVWLMDGCIREEMVHALTRMGTVNNAEEEAEKCMQVEERVKMPLFIKRVSLKASSHKIGKAF